MTLIESPTIEQTDAASGKQNHGETNSSNNGSLNIPSEYRGLPSQMVAEMWQPVLTKNPERNKQLVENKQNAIDALKKKELAAAQQRGTELQGLLDHLSTEQKAETPKVQTEVMQAISQHLAGKNQIENLTVGEIFVLDKLTEAYQKAKRQNPDKPVTFQLAQPIDAMIFENLKKRLVFDKLKTLGKIQDKKSIQTIREQIGVTPETSPILNNGEALAKLKEFMEARANKSSKPEIYRDLFKKLQIENNTAKIAETLVNEINLNKRQAEYPTNDNYAETWDIANTDNSLNHKLENGWIYRGNFPSKEKLTQTRGSLNITIDQNALRKLDDLITRGIVDANYKFGEPNTRSDAGERHDAITLYFLTTPSPEALKAISDIAQRHFRGNNLIGNKISEGFYMSEVGSVSDKQAEKFLTDLNALNPDLSKAMKIFLTSMNTSTKSERVAMSEAQFYSVKETLEIYGIQMTFDKDAGIKIK
jgi:hypothetical protein